MNYIIFFILLALMSCQRNDQSSDYNFEKKMISSMSNHSAKFPSDDIRLKSYLSSLKEMYEVLYSGKLVKREQNRWMNVVEQGADLVGVYRGFVNDVKYLQLEAEDWKVGGVLEKQFNKILIKYTDSQITKDSLKVVSYWRYRKVSVETFLEKLDELTFKAASYDKEKRYYNIQSKEQYFKMLEWYAKLSVDLSEGMSKDQNQLRRSNDFNQHVKWALSVPYEMLQSELIIKLYLYIHFYQAL